MPSRGWRSAAAYAGLLAASSAAGITLSRNFGGEIDNYAYDFMLRRYQPQPWPTGSAIVAIDEPTLRATPGGMQGIRKPLAETLRVLTAARPKAVAIDVTLADRGDPKVDADLAEAMRTTPNLVLATDLSNDAWDDPLPEFARFAAALGHVHAAPDPNDEITRGVSLLKTFGNRKKWALSLEAFRLSSGASEPLESPDDLQVGGTTIPVPDKWMGPSQHGDGRFMRVRFVPAGMQPIPRISMVRLLQDHSLAQAFAGKAAFVGVTAMTAVKDRLMTPLGSRPGIEINAEAFETMAQRLFITDVSGIWVWLFSVGLTVAHRARLSATCPAGGRTLAARYWSPRPG